MLEERAYAQAKQLVDDAEYMAQVPNHPMVNAVLETQIELLKERRKVRRGK